ncbi:hypothetical protein Trydic_g19192 [Trypoxylus dichotomus]
MLWQIRLFQRCGAVDTGTGCGGDGGGESALKRNGNDNDCEVDRYSIISNVRRKIHNGDISLSRLSEASNVIRTKAIELRRFNLIFLIKFRKSFRRSVYTFRTDSAVACSLRILNFWTV